MTMTASDRRLETIGSALGTHTVVHLVANGVRGDSRVIKAAQASRAAGYPTVLVGITVRPEPVAFVYGDIPVILVPISRQDTAADRLRLRHLMRRVALRRVERAVRGRRPGGITSGLGLDADGLPEWSAPQPVTAEYTMSFVDALEALRPAVIHCHDIHPLPASVAYSAAEHFKRRAVRVIYDAHECVPELARHHAGVGRFEVMESIESTFIRDAGRVLTVSDQIAKLLRDRYGLSSKPTVVLNAPSAVRDETAPDLRTELGLGPDVPLAVYSGWIDPERGLGTAVQALPSLPDLHLAVVTNAESAALRNLLALARELRVLDRVHVTSYVRPEQVTAFLSSATVGLIPRNAGPHLDLSLPTKYREYLHAGLPLIVCNNAAMARETNRTKVGRVFRAGNVSGLALQLRRVLEEPDRYRAAITPELLARHSWEQQAETLSKVYRVSGGTPVNDVAAAQRKASEATRRAYDDVVELDDLAHWRRTIDQKRVLVSLGIGRANSAGQATAWARAAATHLNVLAQSFAPRRRVTDRPNVVVPHRAEMVIEPAATELARVLGHYTHVIVDGFEQLFGSLVSDDLDGELRLLARHRVRVGLLAHGSDVRDPDRHVAEVPYSYFTIAGDEWTDTMRTISLRNRKIANDSDLPLFVSTPDLLRDVPRAQWLPLVVDIARWSSLPPIQEQGALRILHRPSRAVPPIKGSDVIEPVLARLADEGLVEYVDGGGEDVPHAEMPALVGSVDVVVDQIRTGSYGVAAVEAMAAGRIVVGGATEHVRAHTDGELPIIDATPETFEAVVRGLAAMPRSERLELGERGRAFAAKWHDGRLAAETLAPFVDAD